MKVDYIEYKDIVEWLLHKHYAHAIPSISHCFGLYNNDDLIGVVSYGRPPSSPLRHGICGSEYASYVLELNRLIVEDGSPANSASYLVSKSLKKLPRPSIIVSFADTAVGHIGYIYQACNFVYTGLSAKRTNWKIRGEEALHGITIADRARGVENRAEYLRKKYGSNFYLEPRPRKHRYVYFVGSKKERKEMKKALRYPILPYPKGKSHKHILEFNIKQQLKFI